VKLIQLVQLEHVQLETACATVAIDHQIGVIQVQVGKKIIDDVLMNGGFVVNIITDNLGVQLGLPKPNSVFYNLLMVDQTITKPLDLIRDLKIFVHGIPYIVTFIVINSSILDSSYSILLRCL
jgi:hypothetical protein